MKKKEEEKLSNGIIDVLGNNFILFVVALVIVVGILGYVVSWIESSGVTIYGLLYMVWLVIKRPLIVIGGLLLIYGVVKFIKRSRKH